MPSSSSKKSSQSIPKGYTLHEPRKGGPSKELLQQRFEKLEKLLVKAKNLPKKNAR
ncbi:MAG: hypothetical protein ACO1O1_12145 [Adhaeribacter sp.]